MVRVWFGYRDKAIYKSGGVKTLILMKNNSIHLSPTDHWCLTH